MSDILIKGISMPASKNQYMKLWVFGDGRVFAEWGTSIGCEQKLPGKAVPLPEKHGRLGDLTEIQKKLQKTLDGMGDKWLSSPTLMAQRVAIVAALNEVKETPTIVPAEKGVDYEQPGYIVGVDLSQGPDMKSVQLTPLQEKPND